MTTTEVANLIEILRGLGWTGDQIADFQLGIEGRLSVKDSIKKVKEQENKNQE
ncbi:MAG: hypothetical protein IJ075_00595 [Lachnospiraceae bacterium]|nr:hypothetical protein [Lachnospiraceae bacterium]